MGIIAKPNTHAPNTVISSSKLNANEDTVYNAINGNIEAANLASNAVTTAKIADSNVTTAKIADLNVTTGKLADGAVTTAKIADANVTSEKLDATIACRAYRNAAMNLTGGGGEEKIILDAESFDLGSNWDTTNGRFTAPVTGYYHISAVLRLIDVGASNNCVIFIYVNGAAYCLANNYGTSASDDLSVEVSTIAPVTAGQYIEMYGDVSTTKAISASSTTTFMSIHFIGV